MPSTPINGFDTFYEVTGDGLPVVFCHEFAATYRSWDPQVNALARLYRCVTWSYRGFPPSAIPPDIDDYSEDILIEDLRTLLEHLDIRQAHLVGLSMGGSIVLNFAMRYPEKCRGVVAAGAGSGSTNREQWDADIAATVNTIRNEGMERFADTYGAGPTRQPFIRKDPKGWRQFRDELAQHSPSGQAFTMQKVQRDRPTLISRERELDELRVPAFIVVGDEDEPCLDVGLFLKRHIRSSGLAILPQTGHTLNLEEPAAFNRLLLDFFHAVESGTWHIA